MRAHARSSLLKLLEAKSSQPADPCGILLGDPLARQQVHTVLGSSSAFPEHPEQTSGVDIGCVCGEALNGLLLVEPVQCMKDASDVTELATFLRGIRDVHSLLLAHACDAHSQDSDPNPSKGALETACLVLEFVKPDAWHHFVTIILVNAPVDDGVTLQEHGRRAMRKCGIVWDATSIIPPIFCMNSATCARELVAHLRGLPPLVCEPLQSSSPLLGQYRAIRQQLGGRRRPPSSSTRSVASRVPTEGGVSPHSSATTPGASSVSQGRSGLHPRPRRRHQTVMLFGKTGAGKSHLANLLLGYPAFDSGDSLASVTKADSVRRAVSQDGFLTVLDTIGFGDTQLPHETVVKSLRDTAIEAPGGIDALLFVLKKERVTPADQETLDYVANLLFGPECLPNLYLAITHAGRLAKDVELRRPWFHEQSAASPPFAAMCSHLGTEPLQRIAFVENSDPRQAEDEEDGLRAEKRRARALDDILALLDNHGAPPYCHGIMQKAKELQAAHLEELRTDLRRRIEDEVRHELDQEREQLHAEVDCQRRSLQEQEEEMQHRFENQWLQMKAEFEECARAVARDEIEPMANEIIQTTEKKAVAKGWRCDLM